MKAASAQLIALLNSAQMFFMADLLTITTTAGEVLRYAQWESDLIVGGNTYKCDAVNWSRSTARTVRGLVVDTMTITLTANPAVTIGGIPIMQAVGNGLLDGATVSVDRVFMPTPGDTGPGTMNVFAGRISEVKVTRYEAEFKIKSWLEILDVAFPVNVFQPDCPNVLFGSACGVTRSSYVYNSYAMVGSTTTQLLIPNSGRPNGYFDLGTITFMTGPNTGATRTIRQFTSGNPDSLNFVLPLPIPPVGGDVIQVVPGCDHTLSGGCTKFSNTGRFRGQPFIPTAETAR